MPWVDLPADWWETREEIRVRHGVTDVEAGTLAIYDAERERGIAHTPEWDAKMAEVRARHDRAAAEIRDRLRAATRADR